MKLNKTHECLNCHEQIGDSNYCPNCGQLNTDKKLPVKVIMQDFLGDYITFDSKFFKSLVPLILKPGYLTREYLSGKRVRYIFPFRLYLFTTFVFFFIIAVNTKMDSGFLSELPGNVKSDSSAVVNDEQISKDSLITVINEIPYIPEKKREELIKKIEAAPEDTVFTGEKSFNVKIGEDESDNSIIRYFQKKAEYISSRKDGANIFWKETINQLPKVLFILLPLFALILKLLYFRRKIFYVEHLIFSLHFHTYIFINLLLAVFFPNQFVIILVIISIHVHLFMSLRSVYQQSRIKTFLKMGILLTSYSFMLIPAFVILVLLAVVSV